MKHNHPDVAAPDAAVPPTPGAAPAEAVPGADPTVIDTAGADAPPGAEERVPVILPGGSTVFLFARQRAVLNSLLQGKDVLTAALAAGVGRASVYRWIERDPSFRAANNDWNRLTHNLTTGRLRMALAAAVSTVLRKAAEGDLNASIFLIRHLKPQLPPFHGATTPADAQREIEAGQKEERLDARMRTRRARHREDDDLFGEWTPDHRK